MSKKNQTGFLGIASIAFLVGVITSCGNNTDNRYVPYTFNESYLDSLTQLKIALVDEIKREDGTVREKRYYLGDSVKYVLTYNKSQALLNVSRFEKAIEVWTENFYPNGQRLSRFTMYTDPKTGEAYYQGPYQAFYETGWLKEEGEYIKDKPKWMLPYTESGLSGDTIYYEYEEQSRNTDTLDFNK